MEALELSPTKAGTPQGGVVSPLLANIALYGMEEALLKAYIGENKAPSAQRGAPQLIRYADDVRHLTHCLIPLGERRSSEETTSGPLNQPGRES